MWSQESSSSGVKFECGLHVHRPANARGPPSGTSSTTTTAFRSDFVKHHTCFLEFEVVYRATKLSDQFRFYPSREEVRDLNDCIRSVTVAYLNQRFQPGDRNRRGLRIEIAVRRNRSLVVPASPAHLGYYSPAGQRSRPIPPATRAPTLCHLELSAPPGPQTVGLPASQDCRPHPFSV